jgi:CDGSH-type Zn-finger protein/uncharacterized Fe-S cluster protein YjdI
VTEARERKGVEREYTNDAIAVQWEPRLCIHTRACIAAMPDVFLPDERPWVRLEGADADRVADAVRKCPTGALHFRRLDGGPQEEPEEELRVVPRPNGPLFLRGRIRIEDADGELIREDTRVALCRCGGSQNKPFCDGTHRTNSFTA